MAIDVYLSVGRTFTAAQETFVAAFKEFLMTEGLNPRTAGAKNELYDKEPVRNVKIVIDECYGAVVLAFERIHITEGAEKRGADNISVAGINIPTVWNHIEGAMANALKLPLLVVPEKRLRMDGILEGGYDWIVKPVDLEVSQINTDEFRGIFQAWKVLVEQCYAAKRQVILLVHGIRTDAYWHQQFDEIVSQLAKSRTQSRNVTVLSRKYGKFLVFEYAMSFLRQRKVEWFREVIEALQRHHPGAEVSIVAHSFGTYLVAEVLKRHPGIKLHSVVLCGSVVRCEFNWEQLIENGQLKYVVNDCGTDDIWSALSAVFIPGTGDSGVWGFRSKGESVRDRYFAYHSHSSYFTQSHIETYWWPFLSKGTFIREPHPVPRPSFVVGLIRTFRWPLRVLALILIILAVTKLVELPLLARIFQR